MKVPKGYLKHKSFSNLEHRITDNKIPDSIDWRSSGVVTILKITDNVGVVGHFQPREPIEGQHAMLEIS